MKAAILVLAIALVSTSPAHGQACEELGVDCRHPSTPQRPSGGGSSSSGNNTGPDASDHASNQSHSGYVYMKRHTQSGSYSDFLAAESEFRNALANIDGYGPAELGLCQLYGRHAERYKEAIAACKIAFESHDFAHGRKVRKWIKKTLMVEINLNWRRQVNSKLRDQFGKACVLTTTSSSDGSTVDPSADTMKFLADCKKWKADLDAQDAKLAKEIAAYNAKQ